MAGDRVVSSLLLSTTIRQGNFCVCLLESSALCRKTVSPLPAFAQLLPNVTIESFAAEDLYHLDVERWPHLPPWLLAARVCPAT